MRDAMLKFLRRVEILSNFGTKCVKIIILNKYLKHIQIDCLVLVKALNIKNNNNHLFAIFCLFFFTFLILRNQT